MPLPSYEPKAPTQRLVYDFETTGRCPRFSEPTQYAAILTDGDLNELSSIDIRGRPSSFTLPEPGALATHGIGVRALNQQPRSQRELMVEIHSTLADFGPVHAMGFNSLAFDEEFMRHASYKTLLPPYAHQMNGNGRGDVMALAQVAYSLGLDALDVPVVDGRPSFKLENLGPANGVRGHQAHDALGDVRATAHLADLIRKRAPGLWAYDARWASKPWVQQLLEGNEVIVHVAYYGRPFVFCLAPICPNPDMPTEWLVADLQHSEHDLLGLSEEDMLAMMQNRRRPKMVRRVKTNGQQGLFPIEEPLVRDRIEIDAATLAQRAAAVRADTGFADRLVQAARAYRAAFEAPQHVEEQLYTGRFMSSADERLCSAFHTADPQERPAIVERISDRRARELGWRLIYEEAPEALPTDRREAIAAERQRRLAAPADSPWVSVAGARERIATERSKRGAEVAELFQEYEEYLETVEGELRVIA